MGAAASAVQEHGAAPVTGGRAPVPWRGLGWALFAAPLLLDAIATLRASHDWLVGRLVDDGFYYLVVGQHLADGSGATFDGINDTNGFHPLWQGVVAVLAVAFQGEALARAAVLVAIGLVAAAGVVLVRVATPVVGAGPALFGAIVAVHSPRFLGRQVDGMESALVTCCVVGVIAVLAWTARAPSSRRVLVLGGACGLAALARLDLAAVVWIVPVALALRLRTPRRVLPWLAGAAVVVAPWYLWMVLRWGDVVTVSARVKAHLVTNSSGELGSAERLGETVGTAVRYAGKLLEAATSPPAWSPTTLAVALRVGLVALAVLGALAWWHQHPRQADRRLTARGSPEGFALAVGVALVGAKAVADLVLATEWADRWYSAPQHLFVPFLVGVGAWWGVRWLHDRQRWLGVAAGALALLVVVPANVAEPWSAADEALPADSWQGAVDDAADAVLAGGIDGTFGARDAGILGFRLRGVAPVVNLDGLMNDRDFADLVIAEAPLRERAEHEGVDVLVQRLDPGPRAQLDCAIELWRSPEVVSGTGDESAAEAYVYVLDLRPCPPTGGG